MIDIDVADARTFSRPSDDSSLIGQLANFMNIARPLGKTSTARTILVRILRFVRVEIQWLLLNLFTTHANLSNLLVSTGICLLSKSLILLGFTGEERKPNTTGTMCREICPLELPRKIVVNACKMCLSWLSPDVDELLGANELCPAFLRSLLQGLQYPSIFFASMGRTGGEYSFLSSNKISNICCIEGRSTSFCCNRRSSLYQLAIC